MGQLIDKTALRKELSKLPSEMGFVRKSDVMQILGSQKCAYDVNQVIKELKYELKLAEQDKERCERENQLQFDFAKGYCMGFYNTLEIVKAGGRNEAN